MTTFELWHRIDVDFRDNGPRAAEVVASFPAGFAHVADVRAHAPEEVWAKTQNIDSDWLLGPDVTPRVVQKGCRSTSVGDIVVDADGRLWSVERVGHALLGTRRDRNGFKSIR